MHAAYVFEPDYDLESIEDHAKYMWENKHMKAVPKERVDESGQEIVEAGSHLRGIVEELEKAHIYIDQLNDQIKDLKKQLAKFNAIKERLDQLETKANGNEQLNRISKTEDCSLEQMPI